jgi:hypothetical protein
MISSPVVEAVLFTDPAILITVHLLVVDKEARAPIKEIDAARCRGTPSLAR